MIFNINEKPDFTNEQGVKWFHYKNGTDYANRNSPGTKPLNAQAWLVEFPNGDRNYALVKDGNVIAEATSIEALGIKIDLLRIT